MPELQQLLDIVLFRHPIHVPLVHFPIALSYFAALLAVLAFWRKDEFFSKAMFFDTALLILSIVPAMATGIYENQTRYNGLAPNTPLKIMLGATLLLLAIVLTVWRWRNPNVMQSRAGLLFILGGAACAGLATALGFLGGIIVWGA